MQAGEPDLTIRFQDSFHPLAVLCSLVLDASVSLRQKRSMNARNRNLLIAAVVVTAGILAFVVWENRHHSPLDSSAGPSAPTRSEAMALAEQYVNHSWTAGAANIHHGKDPKGIPVNTLDAAGKETHGIETGWWLVGETNVGLPYKWGGFDTPESFDAGLREGKYAGDAYSSEKRRLLDLSVSESAVGIDCSGFISRCWQLSRSYSTRELPDLCEPVPDPAQLRPGDILNRNNNHVRMFVGWEDQSAGLAIFYEASARVHRKVHDIDEMFREGYQAWRYRGMRD